MKTLDTYISESIMSSSGAGKAKVNAEYEKYGLEPNWVHVNDDGTITYWGNVYLAHKGLKHIPFRFKEVIGNFIVYDNELTTLEGCPIKLRGRFDCSCNKLTNLKGGPEIHKSDYYMCHNNKLETLEGAPKVVHGSFACWGNKLKSLAGGPEKVNKDYDCSINEITTLEGMPKEVGGDFDCSSNELRTLPDVSCVIKGKFDCSCNMLDLQPSEIINAGIKAKKYITEAQI